MKNDKKKYKLNTTIYIVIFLSLVKTKLKTLLTGQRNVIWS